MSAFASSCGFRFPDTTSRAALAPAVVSTGRFAQTPRRSRYAACAQNCASRAQRSPMRMEESSPPINAPSAVLLLSSSVLAIASVGCVFELTGGHPTYGAKITSAILAVSLPGFLFLFYSAIRKGQQEALDDP